MNWLCLFYTWLRSLFSLSPSPDMQFARSTLNKCILNLTTLKELSLNNDMLDTQSSIEYLKKQTTCDRLSFLIKELHIVAIDYNNKFYHDSVLYFKLKCLGIHEEKYVLNLNPLSEQCIPYITIK